ncbi:hypothetical protein GCM10009839_32570 [Catenulispora yoronensis]|uniref:Uncharacterized protein n=1 Tax=Catenulispora yoronensis TaxID=450799 RepID=A0ABP5FR92_9ACTN
MGTGFSVDPSHLDQWAGRFSEFGVLAQHMTLALGEIENRVRACLSGDDTSLAILYGAEPQFRDLSYSTDGFHVATNSATGGIQTAANDYRTVERRAYEAARIPQTPHQS